MNEDLMDDAERVVLAFMERHKSAAIPALIGYCVMWAVDNGGLSLVKDTLARVSAAADDMEAIRQETAQ